jgi:hypothetical protein
MALCGGAWASVGRSPLPATSSTYSSAVVLRVIGGAGTPDAAGGARSPVAQKRIIIEHGGDQRDVERFFEATVNPGASVLDILGSASKVRVDLDLNDASIRDALKQVFDQAKATYTLDADIPADVRVTVKARNVQLHTAVNLITEAGGVGWTLEQKLASAVSLPTDLPPAEREKRLADAMAGTYHVGKTITTRNLFSRVMVSGKDTVWSPSLRLSDSLLPYTLYGKEDRSTFTCPHCRQQSTMVRVKQQPKCPKCTRMFQPEWQFCPADGTRRPAIPGEWRFCPACGKQVMPEKAEDRGEPMGQSLPIPLPTRPDDRDSHLMPTTFTGSEKAPQQP